jgi:hypothetical protein
MCACRDAVFAAVVFAAPAAAQVYVPIPVTGYTQDVIAEAGGATAGPVPLQSQIWRCK